MVACRQSPSANLDLISRYYSLDSTDIFNIMNPGTCFHCYAIYTHLPRLYEQNPQLKIVYIFPKVRAMKQNELKNKIKFGANYDADFIFNTERYNSLMKQFNASEAQNFLIKIENEGRDTSALFIDHLDKSLTKRKEVVDFLKGEK